MNAMTQMKTLKELIKTTLVDVDGLSNLAEKGAEGFYEDAPFAEEEVPELWKNIANELADKVMKVDFDKLPNPGSHPFINCKKTLAKKLGFDNITVCAYKGIFHEPWLESNFLAQVHPDKDDKPVTSFFIDIYDCEFLDREQFYEFIIQELFNFQRDIEWVAQGVYDEKLEEMKG